VSGSGLTITKVQDTDHIAILVALSEGEGYTFLMRLEDEWRTGSNRFDAAGENLFVARMGDNVVGVCGLNIDPYAGDPGVGRVRHLYVAPPFRRQGVGSALVERTVLQARAAAFERLRLRTSNQAAAAFYEACGFRRGGGPSWTHELVLAPN
jgi:ribosomal protein S18 acetylase RimI-like enzyme